MRPNAAALRASLLLVVAACAGGRSAAPEPPHVSPELVPAPLVAALIGGAGGVAAARSITVHSLPPEYPAELVPPPAYEALGGMKRGRDIIAIFTDSTRSLPAVLGEQLARTGYVRPPGDMGSGFAPPFRTFSDYCKDDTFVSVVPIAGQPGRVRVSVRRMPERPCGTPLRSQENDRLVLPGLMPPADARVRGFGGGGSDREVDSHAEASGAALVPADIVAHYVAQLVEAGWTASEPAVSAQLAAQLLEARDPAGRPWHGVITAYGRDSTLYLKLTMSRRETP